MPPSVLTSFLPSFLPFVLSLARSVYVSHLNTSPLSQAAHCRPSGLTSSPVLPLPAPRASLPVWDISGRRYRETFADLPQEGRSWRLLEDSQ